MNKSSLPTRHWPLILGAVCLLSAILLGVAGGGGGKSVPLRELSVSEFNKEVVNQVNQPHYYILFNALGTSLPCPACAPAAAVMATLNANLKGQDIRLATVELKSARELFERLQLEAAPTLVYFPAGGQRPPQVLDYRLTMDLPTLTSWIKSTSGIEIETKSQRLPLLLMAMAVICLVWQYGGPALRSPHLWSAMAGIFLLTMTNGLMWCKIREAPVHGFTAKGGTQWLAAGMSNQFYAETILLTILQSMASLGMCLLAAHGHDSTHPWLSLILSLVVMTTTSIVYGTQMYLFRVKQPAYPFRFLTVF